MLYPIDSPVSEFKEFEPRLKHGWFHLKLYSIFQDLRRRLIETGFGRFKPRLKFIKFGHWKHNTYYKGSVVNYKYHP